MKESELEASPPLDTNIDEFNHYTTEPSVKQDNPVISVCRESEAADDIEEFDECNSDLSGVDLI